MRKSLQYELFCEFEAKYSRVIRFTHPSKAVFTLQNGGDLLRTFFQTVETREYIDSFMVTEPDALLEYINSVTTIPMEWEPKLMEIIKDRFDKNGIMHITKEQGMFICK